MKSIMGGLFCLKGHSLSLWNGIQKIICLVLWIGGSSICATVSFIHSFKKIIHSATQQQVVPEIFTVADFTSSSDGAFSHQELVALLGLASGAVVTREQFMRSLERIRQTQAVIELQFTFAGPSEAQIITCHITCDWIISSLKLEGVATGKDEYLRLYELVPGEPFEREVHQKSVKNLLDYLHGQGYTNARIIDRLSYDEKNKWVAITLIVEKGKLIKKANRDRDAKKKQTKQKLQFEGNCFFSKSSLERKVNEMGEADLFLPSLLIMQELQQTYEKRGFYKVSINCLDTLKEMVFQIQEGPRCAVKKIILVGVESYDVHLLQKKFFKCRGSATRWFDEKYVHDVLADLIRWYKKQGFWDAKIIYHDYVKRKDKDYLFFLKIVLEEGDQRLLSKIVVHGVPQELLDGMPFYKMVTKQNESIPFPVDAIMQQRDFLIKQMKNAGYMQAKCSYALSKEEGGLGITWTCNKGKKVTFGKTIMRGQTKIAYNYITQLLSYKEGQLWNKEKIQRSLTVLRGTGVFDRVTIFPSFKDLVEHQRDMIVVLKDDDPFEVKLRMGFAQVSKNFYFKKGSTYTIGGSFIWKNPCAHADKFSIDLDFNRFEQKINVAYRLPLLGKLPLATTFKGYANKYIQPIVIGSSKPLYRVLQQGFLMGLSKIGMHHTFGFTSGFEWMEINDISLEVAHAINFETNLVDKKIPYYFIEPMIYVDFLNDKINPTRGFFSAATIKGMFPFKESSWFVKFLAEQGMFVSIKSSVIAMRIRAGHIFRKDFRAIVPPERFFLGGPYSVRSYLQDYCPPLGEYVNDKGILQQVPQGGKTMINANFEIRFPVYKKVVWGTWFQDFGMLLEDPRDFFTRAQPLAATGFGVRYLSPVGPLRFDIGWKWRKDRPETNAYAWFLTLGNAF